MQQLTVTSKGQLTLRKSIMEHLGIQPGEGVEVVLEPGGKASLQAIKRTKDWSSFRGILQGAGNGLKLSIEELNEAIADAGAAAGVDIEY